MEKKKDFIMVPMFIDDDPRLKPWLEDSRANDREIIWAVERMIGRLAKLKGKPCSIGKLLEGLHRRQLPFPLLKEIVVASGFFNYEDGQVFYDWDRFTRKFVEKAPIRPQSGPNEAPTTPARDLKATNVDKDIDIDVDR